YSEVKLIDLTNKGKFEAEFYLKQYGITYEFDYDFSDKVKRGNVMRQSIEAGSVISISGDNVQTLKVTISKGPKIVIPDLSKLSVSEITSWVIDHKLKIEFKDRYDDSVKENEVLEVNYKNGDVVEEGTIIIVTLSKGCLVMEKFDSYADFRNWADTYGVKYEEEHEFSDSVKVGEVIKYSYEAGSAIKNDDVVIVTISDGKKIKVPSVKGLTKSNAINKLESAGLGYSFVYKYSNDVEKGKVITQSITAGSEVSEGTTVTVTLSNGAKPSASNNNSSSNSGSSSGSNSGSSSESPSTPTCTPTTYKISRELNNIFDSGDSFSSVQSQLYSFFANNYPNVKISVVAEADTGMSSGSYIGGIGPGSEITSCNSSPYVIKLAK
ncbi:MAG: PASTA domain-containing protein, partial [bacterium]|nr:PASTA domain-containing protein [bacterium]